MDYRDFIKIEPVPGAPHRTRRVRSFPMHLVQVAPGQQEMMYHDEYEAMVAAEEAAKDALRASRQAELAASRAPSPTPAAPDQSHASLAPEGSNSQSRSNPPTPNPPPRTRPATHRLPSPWSHPRNRPPNRPTSPISPGTRAAVPFAPIPIATPSKASSSAGAAPRKSPKTTTFRTVPPSTATPTPPASFRRAEVISRVSSKASSKPSTIVLPLTSILSPGPFGSTPTWIMKATGSKLPEPSASSPAPRSQPQLQ